MHHHYRVCTYDVRMLRTLENIVTVPLSSVCRAHSLVPRPIVFNRTEGEKEAQVVFIAGVLVHMCSTAARIEGLGTAWNLVRSFWKSCRINGPRIPYTLFEIFMEYP